MRRVVVIHFAPLELYPPIQNLISELAKSKKRKVKITVLTTATVNSMLAEFRSDSADITIKRFGKSGNHIGTLKRYGWYLQFYTCALFWLMVRRPDCILYYETLSSFPAYLYKKFLKRSAPICVHYHEYTSADEYKYGMFLTRLFWRFEQWLLPRAAWVSHTNATRLSKFIEDIRPVEISTGHVVPNYPPCSWYNTPKKEISLPVRIVYVGSLSIDTMYTREFADWVIAQKGNVVWDVYSNNFDDTAAKYIRGLNSQAIVLKQGVNYHELPGILRQYDVGVILYKGHIPNYVYNAPNKLFEYLACGLDVWFPTVMEGSLPYIEKSAYPKVLAIDFTKLDNLDLNVVDKTGLELTQRSFYCEDVLTELIHKLENG